MAQELNMSLRLQRNKHPQQMSLSHVLNEHFFVWCFYKGKLRQKNDEMLFPSLSEHVCFLDLGPAQLLYVI